MLDRRYYLGRYLHFIVNNMVFNYLVSGIEDFIRISQPLLVVGIRRIEIEVVLLI